MPNPDHPRPAYPAAATFPHDARFGGATFTDNAKLGEAREAIRCLKRYLAREIYTLLQPQNAPPATA